MKPDFVVIGAMKCGTSTVCAYLEDHPDVFMVKNSEPNYFSHDDNFSRGPEWYGRFFADHDGQSICGEGSNYYSARALFPKAAERIATHNPRTKIIYMVRNPLTRIVSAWAQNRSDKGDAIPYSVDLAVTEMPDVFIGQSLYWHNIEPYRSLFPDDQIFVGFMEDMSSHPDKFFRGLCEFLDIPFQSVVRAHQNPSSGKLIPTRRYSVIKKMPLLNRLKKLAPVGLRKSVKNRFLSQKLRDLPDFSAEVRKQVLEVVAPDARQFLSSYGKPEDFWVLDQPQ
jgi:hypothetical protein